jgi:hypothetical protein
MNDENLENESTALDVLEDNSLKEEDDIKRKYFNGGNINLTKLHPIKKKPKSQMMNMNQQVVYYI